MRKAGWIHSERSISGSDMFLGVVLYAIQCFDRAMSEQNSGRPKYQNENYYEKERQFRGLRCIKATSTPMDLLVACKRRFLSFSGVIGQLRYAGL